MFRRAPKVEVEVEVEVASPEPVKVLVQYYPGMWVKWVPEVTNQAQTVLAYGYADGSVKWTL